jgi:hypothetical protein
MTLLDVVAWIAVILVVGLLVGIGDYYWYKGLGRWR